VKPHTEFMSWVRALTFQLLEEMSLVSEGGADWACGADAAGNNEYEVQCQVPLPASAALKR
jgi:hypothetical protein